ncbi:MAG: class I SAM-dependent methyltransferase [Phycisphaerales bacterium]|nr:class I SAM-dependent methyltransferase [Phycisphaerales bacterium]
MPACRVCGGCTLREFAVIDARTYWRCEICQATLLADAHLPTIAQERARYESHQNDPNDGEYRRFLTRLAAPLIERLPAAQQGLDYGCGPGPALAAMLTDAGHTMRLWDPIFHADAAVLDSTYDFIACSEVVEHFHQPRTEFRRFHQLLKPGGWLALMTTFQTDDVRFAQWYYRRDPTHVSFYRAFTLRHIAAQLGWTIEIPSENVAIMRKGMR